MIMKKNGKSIKINIESLSKYEKKFGISYDTLSDLTANFSNFNLELEGDFSNKVITFSKNVFLPISTFCKNRCTYCNFRDNEKDSKYSFLEKNDLDPILSSAKLTKTKEALITCGQSPDTYEFIQNRLCSLGYSSMVGYISDICKYIYDIYGLFPHLNLGVISSDEIKTLRDTLISIGLMLETSNSNLSYKIHKNSKEKNPKTRLKFLEKCAKLNIPTTTGILLGVGETNLDRTDSLFALRKIQRKYGSIQEIILQKCILSSTSQISFRELKTVLILAKLILPDVSLQIPPNITPSYLDLLPYGIDDFGGISDVTSDYINPKFSWPNLIELKNELSIRGYLLKERLGVYPQFIQKKYIGNFFQKVQNIVDYEGYVRSEFSCI